MTRFLLTSALIACNAFAQFEVAAIRPTPSGATQQFCGPPFGSQPSTTQYVLLSCTVRALVGRAWDLRKFEFPVPANPAWISSARYDITAKSAAPVNPMQHERMLRSLLEDRFRLKWHREKRDQPIYFLTMAKSGLKLKPTVPDTCVPWDRKAPPPFPMPGKPPTCDYILHPQTPDGLGMGMEGIGVPMSSLASQLTDLLGRPVIDNTGFSGIFDIHLTFARDSSLAYGSLPDEPGQAHGEPNIFTAIRSIGLNIVSGKGPVDVFIIDSVQRPSEN
jgi:uncharacterized protein (TIGR03435 family)